MGWSARGGGVRGVLGAAARLRRLRQLLRVEQLHTRLPRPLRQLRDALVPSLSRTLHPTKFKVTLLRLTARVRAVRRRQHYL